MVHGLIRRLTATLLVLAMGATATGASAVVDVSNGNRSARSPAARTTSAAVTWDVDHPARTITVTIRIAIYVPGALSPDVGEGGAGGGGHLPTGGAEQLAAAAARITADILKKWSNLQFKCYQFIVNPIVRVVSGNSAVAVDEFAVELTNALYTGGTWAVAQDHADMGSYVYRFRNPFTSHLSDDAGADGSIASGPSIAHSAWDFLAQPGTYAHEVGHLLGLDDTYTYFGHGLKEGAPGDLMFDRSAGVSPEMVTKVVRRSGAVDESTIKCPFSIDLADSPIGIPFGGAAGTAGGTVGYHAWACDYDPPTSDPTRRRPISVTVLFRGFGQADAGPFGAASGGGVTTVSVSIPPPPGAGGAESIFDILLPTGLSVQTRVEFGPTGLRTVGATSMHAGGGALDVGNRPTVSDGAPECE